MPLTPNLKNKLPSDFLATMVAVGEAIIAAKVPASMAYALRDEVPFEAWPDDAIEATGRLVVELRRRLAVATRELLEQVQTVQPGASDDSSTGKNKGSKRDQGKHRGESPRDKKPEKTGSPPTEKASESPQRDNAA